MPKTPRFCWLLSAVAGVAVLALTSGARADFIMQVTDNPTGGLKGGNSFVIDVNDNGPTPTVTVTTYGSVQPAAATVLTFSNSHIQATAGIDGYGFQITAHANEDTGGSQGIVGLSVTITPNGATKKEKFQLSVLDQGFTIPATGNAVLYDYLKTGSQFASGDSVIDDAYLNFKNPGFQQVQTKQGVPLTGPGQSFAATPVPFSLTTPYNLAQYTQTIDKNFTGVSQFSGTSVVAGAVPAPGGLLLVMAGVPLIGVAGVYRKLRRKVA